MNSVCCADVRDWLDDKGVGGGHQPGKSQRSKAWSLGVGGETLKRGWRWWGDWEEALDTEGTTGLSEQEEPMAGSSSDSRAEAGVEGRKRLLKNPGNLPFWM